MRVINLLLTINTILLIFIYYRFIKTSKICMAGNKKVKIYTNSLLSFILKIYNKIFKTFFIAITNPLSYSIHIISKDNFDSINNSSILFLHELTHIYQIKYYGKIKFIILYLIYSVKLGYNNNYLEKQAVRWSKERYVPEAEIQRELKNLKDIYGDNNV